MTRPTVVSVYVPLCSERCAFCDCLTIPSTLRDVVRYREALLAEIDAVAPDLEGQRVEAVRFDGGVPLLMGGARRGPRCCSGSGAVCRSLTTPR